jgi:hypothetical protein
MTRSLRRSLPLLLTVACSGLLPACGGGGEGDISGVSTLTFAPSSDVVAQSDTAGATSGGLVAGDNDAGLSTRTLLRFGITPFLPTGATVISATLRIRQTGVVGTPYTLLGSLVVDRADFGVSVGGTDYNPTILAANIGTLSTTPAIGFLEVDVTAAVAADLADNDFTSDFLVRFVNAVAANGTADAALFEDSENSRGTGFEPELIVEYQ